MAATPLSVLDLAPIPSGSSAADALRNTVDLARHAEDLGYRRYWLAEHHLNPGVAGTSPALLIGQVAAATTTLRVGSGAFLMGHRTPLAVVEEVGILDALHPGRIDLGLGRSPGKPSGAAPSSGPPPEARTLPNGVRIPARFDPSRLMRSPRLKVQKGLLAQPGATAPKYAEQVETILALLGDGYTSPEGITVRATPGGGADVEVWILGSSGGESASVAGDNALPFAANYHVSPATVLDAVEGYRAAFRPGPRLDRPHVAVSADCVVAPNADEARELAAGYGLWVRSIRTGEGAIPYPDRDQAEAHRWSDEDRELVVDRLETQLVGTPGEVADRLTALQEATGADELVVTTMTHDHAARVRSYRLLAEEWERH